MRGQLLWQGMIPAGAAALAAMVWTAAVAAEPPQPSPAEPLRVRLEVDEECPAAATFAEQLVESTPHLRPAQPNELARTVDVLVVSRGGDSLGQLQVVLADGTEVDVMTTGSCDQVLSVLLRLAARVLAPASVDVETAESADLPENPYWRLLSLPLFGHVSALPRNPYYRWLACRSAGNCWHEAPPNGHQERRGAAPPPAPSDEDVEHLSRNPYR